MQLVFLSHTKYRIDMMITLSGKMKISHIAVLLLLFSMNAMAGNTAIDSHPAQLVVKETTDKVLAVL